MTTIYSFLQYLEYPQAILAKGTLETKREERQALFDELRRACDLRSSSLETLPRVTAAIISDVGRYKLNLEHILRGIVTFFSEHRDLISTVGMFSILNELEESNASTATATNTTSTYALNTYFLLDTKERLELLASCQPTLEDKLASLNAIFRGTSYEDAFRAACSKSTTQRLSVRVVK